MTAHELVLHWSAGDDPALLREREWILTNGLGGYASGTLLGPPTRKYHGLFVPNLSLPKGRHVMISRYDEQVLCNGQWHHLGGAEFSATKFSGEAHRYLQRFRLEKHIATWTYDFGVASMERSIVMPHNQNTACVVYRMLRGEPVRLKLRPYTAFRRHDADPQTAIADPFTLIVVQGRHEIHTREGALRLRMCVSPKPAVFVAESVEETHWLRLEFTHGYPAEERAFSPGYFTTSLTAQEPVAFVATTQSWESLDFDVLAAFDAESRRAENLLLTAQKPHGDSFAAQLTMAADQFVTLPGSRFEESVLAEAAGSHAQTVIAGYHWFADWGRDTMISLEGLTLCTGREREARAILETFSRYMHEGLLPNLFPEGEREGLYHTADATLWYFQAIHRYLSSTQDQALLQQLYPVLAGSIEKHLQGTLFGIKAAEDGLLSAGAEGYQLTWMDAKVGDWVVTPRRGKPVEIQALWYNALRLMQNWSESLGHAPALYREHAERARASFNRRFWNESAQALFDVIDGPQGDDAAFRPNQLFAISLPHEILDRERWQVVIDGVQKRLLTPFGLRTLSADHPDYKRTYQGDLRSRDAAYHQGTVWPWLMGHFIDAWLKVHADKKQAKQMLAGFHDHLCQHGFGSVSEIFDAEPPHKPHGCIAQAWSVAELLRAWHSLHSL